MHIIKITEQLTRAEHQSIERVYLHILVLVQTIICGSTQPGQP